MTYTADVINEGMKLIDDVTLVDDLSNSPPHFFRRMWGYLSNAMSTFTEPPEMVGVLYNRFTAPKFGNFEWVSTDGSVGAETVIQTGLTGFDLFNCALFSLDAAGAPFLEKSGAFGYNKATGEVTAPEQPQNGLVYTMDFYTDGYWENDLTPQQIRILALGIAYQWFARFANTYLNIQPKIHSKSFDVPNEANKQKADTERLEELRRQYYDEMKAYSQRCAYYGQFPQGRRTNFA